MQGNIEERSPGVWRIRVSCGNDPVTGERRIVRKTIRGARADAELARAQILAERGAGDLGTNATLNTLLDAWLTKARVATSTRATYENAAKVHIRPRIGKLPLARVTPFVLDQLYEDLLDDGVSPDRIRKVHTVLRASLRRAVKWRWIPSNPALDAERPPVETKEAAAPDPETVRLLLALAEKTGLRWLVIIRIAASLGARRGEICGLQWRDINFAAGTIHVRRSVLIIKGERIVKQLKNEKRRSPEPMPPDVMRLLREWKLQSVADSLADGGDWLFVSPLGGFADPSEVSKKFRRICTTAGIQPTVKLHGLRHYVGTHLRDAGVDHDVISRRLGHSRTSTTIDMYGHAVAGRSRQAAEILERITQEMTGTDES